MTLTNPPTMAANWAQQSASPPPSAKRAMTPAARHFLRSHGFTLDFGSDADLPSVVHLAEARALARGQAARSGTAPSAAEGAPQPGAALGPWASKHTVASVDTPVPPGQSTGHRLARAIAAAAAAVREHVPPPLRTVIRLPAATSSGTSRSVVLGDVSELSVSGIERQLGADCRSADITRDAGLEIIDGSALGATRLIATAEGRVVVTIGAPVSRVIAHMQSDGHEAIGVRSVLEVWVHGGGVLDAFATASLARAVGRAVGLEEAP